MLQELNQNGIAITSVQTLLGPNSCYEELSVSLERLEETMKDEIAQRRAQADQPPVKSYMVALLGSPPVLEPDNICCRFALQDAFLGVADAYFGMWTKLNYYNYWHHFVTRTGPRGAHQWHNDPGDHFLLKVFVYLSDVDGGSGPLVYAPGTHRKGTVRRRPAVFATGKDAEGKYSQSTDAQMADVVPAKEWRTCVGPKGTVVFWDQVGYHKGGFCRERERLLYTCLFTDQAGPHEIFRRLKVISRSGDDRRDFALSALG